MSSSDAGLPSVYVIGARQRNSLVKAIEEEWKLYDSAVILGLDTETGQVETSLEYNSPPEVRPNDSSATVFNCGTVIGDKLYVCTWTEVLIYSVPEFRHLGYISLPSFNSLHHVTPSHDGNVLIVSTGLDMVIKCTPQGRVLQEWSVLDEEPWSRFSRDTDYRKVESTKPHKSHPNFVFELDDQVWATRFYQKDAVCLEDRAKRIDIAIQYPHDGLPLGGRIYFTTVDGRIVVANARTFKVEEIIDLKEFGKDGLLGWCRGVLPVDDRRILVGFSRIRHTKFKENILWARSFMRNGAIEQPTHIALYDLVEKRCVQEFNLEPYGINTLFSILPMISEDLACVPEAAGAVTSLVGYDTGLESGFTMVESRSRQVAIG